MGRPAASLRRAARLVTGRSDAVLLRAARAGHRSAGVLARRYRSELVRYADQLLDDQALAQRLVDEALLHEAITESAYADVAPTARALVYGLVHRRVADKLQTHAGPARVAVAALPRRYARLLEALRTLPLQQRSALLLREAAGLSREELAHVLDRSAAATRDVLVRARVAVAEASEQPDQDRWPARLRRIADRARRG